MAMLKDIAQATGLHVSTVSKALRGSSDIKEETKVLVRNVAKQMNYKYSVNDDDSDRSTNFIGVICPEIESNFYSHLVSSIEQKVKKEGYSVIVGFTNFETENEKYYLNHMIKSNAAGVIFISEGDDLDPVLENFLSKTEIPLVLISPNFETHKFDCIRIDDRYGIKLIVEHLMSLDHQKICYIGDESANIRLKTFVDILKENNLSTNKSWLRIGKERFEKCGYEEMREILKGDELPTAVFAAYDDIAIGAIKAIHEKGLRVPEDISIIGIDNIRVSEFLLQGLTTVACPTNEMGTIATSILFNKIHDKQSTVIQNIKLSPSLVIRNSTNQNHHPE